MRFRIVLAAAAAAAALLVWWSDMPWLPSGTSSGVSAIDDLSDVDTTTSSPTVGDLFEWDGSNWVPVTPGASAEDLRSELLMQDGVTNPPVPVETEDQDDWLYADQL